MITMTIREALAIQAEQLDYYRDRYPHLEAAAIGATRVPADADLDEPLPVRQIKAMIPRGCDLGQLIGEPF